MFKHFLVSSLIIGYARYASATPEIGVSEESIHFGEFGHNERPERTLTIHNSGDSPLEVTKIKPSCDCIKVNRSSISSIAAGKSAKITVSMHSGRQMGEVKKKLKISSNDPTTPLLTLPVSISVFKDFTSRPTLRSFTFNAGKGLEPVSQEVEIVQRPGVTRRSFVLEVESIIGKFGSPGEKFITAQVSPTEDGQRIRVTLSPDHPAGRINAELTGRLDGKQVVFPIRGEMHSGILLEPKNVDLNQIDVKNPESRVVTFRSITGNPFEITSVTVEPLKTTRGRVSFKFDVRSSPDRKVHRLIVQPIAGTIEKTKRHFSGKIQVATTHPEKKAVTVKYFGLFAR